jgi:hypothetical protein
MGAESIAEVEQRIASQDAREAEATPDTPEVEQEESAASVNDAETPEEGAESEAEEGQQAESGKAKPHKKPGVHNRIGELTREKHEARREAEFWREQALKNKQPEAKESQGADVPLTLEAFDYDQEKYLAALAEKKAQEIFQKAETERQQAEAKRQREQAVQSFKEKADAFAAQHEDFADVVYGNPELQINDAMAEYIQQSDAGPQVAYHLGTHPDEAARIAGLSPFAAGAALARLEDRLTATSAPQVPAQPAQITRAPPVAQRVSAAAPGVKPMDDFADHLAAVRAQVRR